MDITLTKIVAAGAMGFGVYGMYKVFELLKIESEKGKDASPHANLMIIGSMVFAIVMMVLSLVVEVIKEKYLHNPYNNLVEELKKLEGEGYYSVDQHGFPQENRLKSNSDTSYILSKALTEDLLKDINLKLEETDNGEKYLAVQKDGTRVVFGHFTKED